MNLKLYTADADYCHFLREVDSRVPQTQEEKQTRPFAGVLLTVGHINYFAPLVSPKPKHKNMKNQIDFIKINNGEWGALNLNNMIPIHKSCIKMIDFKILPTDDRSEKDYKNLLFNQFTWCNSNREEILNKAAKLHKIIISKQARPELTKRCCNFLIVEEQYRKYCILQGLVRD